MQRVVVTGVGVVSPFGAGATVLAQALNDGRSGLSFNKELGFVVSLETVCLA